MSGPPLFRVFKIILQRELTFFILLINHRRTATNAEGSVIVVTEIETLSTSSSKSSVAPVTATIHETLSAGNSTSSAKSDKKDDPPLSTGAIVGISVGGGVAVLALVGFIIWKFKQKRFGSFDDDDGRSPLSRNPKRLYEVHWWLIIPESLQPMESSGPNSTEMVMKP